MGWGWGEGWVGMGELGAGDGWGGELDGPDHRS